MKASKVMDLLQISRSTLRRYRRNGTLKAQKLPTGQYRFDDDSVFLLKNGWSKRITVIYGRVSTYKQKPDLANQMQELNDFCVAKGYTVTDSFQDIASDIFLKTGNSSFKCWT